MKGAHVDDRVAALLDPVRSLVEHGLAHLPDVPTLEIRVGEIEGMCQLDGQRLTLSSALEGPAIHHPGEARRDLPPLDRWRRAAGCVLEAAALLAMSQRVSQPPNSDWIWTGAAIYAADAVAPQLGVALPDVALAIRTADPGSHPRAGVAVMRAWRAAGQDPIARAAYLLDGGVLSTSEWLRLGTWILDPSGAGAALPVAIDRAPDADIPVELGPWSWQPLRIPAHARGGLVRVDGDGEVDDPWAAADREHRALAGATAGGCRLVPDHGGPHGLWAVSSAEGFGQVMGARGISFRFLPSGRVEIVLADAFVGPLAAVAMAEQVGTSGVVQGRWYVAGRSTLRFRSIETQSLTMHGRQSDPFMMPAKGFGMGEWLTALSENPWGWHQRGDRLVMRGRMMGGEVEIRLRREA